MWKSPISSQQNLLSVGPTLWGQRLHHYIYRRRLKSLKAFLRRNPRLHKNDPHFLQWTTAAARSHNENSIPWQMEKNLIDAIYSRGRRQIMEANISPTCRQTALTKLSHAAIYMAESSMNCTTTKDYAEDVGEIVLSIWDSIGKLMDDVNTVVNSIPICMSGYASWNIFGKIKCLFTNFTPVWEAVKDFWHFKDFWMNPYNEIKAFVECIKHKKSITTSYVNEIVNNARYCN